MTDKHLIEPDVNFIRGGRRARGGHSEKVLSMCYMFGGLPYFS